MEIERKVIIKKIIIFAILFLLTLSMFFVQLSISNDSKNNLPNAVAIRSSNGLNIKFNDIDNLHSKIAGVNQSKGSLTKDFSSKFTIVNVYKTSSDFDKLIPLDFIKGNYFIDGESPALSRYIVISESLAVEYFQNTNVVGLGLVLDNIDYTICGVYRDNKKVLNRLSQNGLENVYIPANSFEDIDSLPVHSVFVRSTSEFVNRIVDDISFEIEKPLYQESVTVYTNTNRIITQSPRITLLFIAFLLSISIIFIVIKCVKNSYRYYKNDDRKHFIIYCVSTVIFVVIGVVVLLLAHFELFLPADILPNDNIFDIKHYLEMFISNVNEKNNYELYDYHWNYSILLMAKSIIINVITLILCFVTWLYGFVNVKKHYKK